MCNIGFREFLKNLKVRLYLTKVGDRYVIQKMKQARVKLGGEQSGHIIFSDNGYCGDGILTAMFIINVMRKQNIKLSELTENLFFKNYQKLINMKTKTNSEKIIRHKEMIKALKNIKIKYKDLDYLIRKSGTENLLRLMVQGTSEKQVNDFIQEFEYEIKEIDEKR